MKITKPRVSEYIERRLAEGAARRTVCYEVRILGAAFSVAVDDEVLAVRPVFKLPTLRNARSGFFEEGDFVALLLELPAHVRPVVQFLRLTGWRKSEALGLTWDQVDWEGQVMRLHTTQTKGSDARVFLRVWTRACRKAGLEGRRKSRAAVRRGCARGWGSDCLIA